MIFQFSVIIYYCNAKILFLHFLMNTNRLICLRIMIRVICHMSRVKTCKNCVRITTTVICHVQILKKKLQTIVQRWIIPLKRINYLAKTKQSYKNKCSKQTKFRRHIWSRLDQACQTQFSMGAALTFKYVQGATFFNVDLIFFMLPFN